MTTMASVPPAPPRWTFGDRLRKVRREQALTQGQLLQRLALEGVGVKALAAWEAGRNTPREAVLIARRVEQLGWAPASWMLGLDDPFDDLQPSSALESRSAGSWSDPLLRVADLRIAA